MRAPPAHLTGALAVPGACGGPAACHHIWRFCHLPRGGGALGLTGTSARTHRAFTFRLSCRWHLLRPLFPQQLARTCPRAMWAPAPHQPAVPQPVPTASRQVLDQCGVEGRSSPRPGPQSGALGEHPGERGCQADPGLAAPVTLEGCPGPGPLPSTQAGRALVVPAIWPFLHAQRAVCRAIVLRGWLLSRSRVTISQVPAAS